MGYIYRNEALRPYQKSWRSYAHVKKLTFAPIICKGQLGALPKAPGCYDPQKKCCVKACGQYFNGEDVEAIRGLIHTNVGGPEGFKVRAHDVFNSFMVKPTGKSVCIPYFCNIVGCSRDRLYYKSQQTFGTARSTGDISVIAWFEKLKDVLDVIPNPDLKKSEEEKRRSPVDTKGDYDNDYDNEPFLKPKVIPIDEYQVHVSTKKQLWQMYLNDVSTLPTCYQGVSYQYFLRLWNKYFPNVKCRQYLRFAKCTTCQTLRDLKIGKGDLHSKVYKRIKDRKKRLKYIREQLE